MKNQNLKNKKHVMTYQRGREEMYKKVLSCRTCSRFYIIGGDQCMCAKCRAKGNFESYKPCYEPEVLCLRPAVKQLMQFRYKHEYPAFSIGAAILLDIYAGVSEDMLQQKYADVYGDIGHENSGYATLCREVIDGMDVNESTVAFSKWFDNYLKEKKSGSINAANAAADSKRNAPFNGMVERLMEIGHERFEVIDLSENGKVLTVVPYDPVYATVWSMQNVKWDTSKIKAEVSRYAEKNAGLQLLLTEPPKLMTEKLWNRYKDRMTEWDVPFWLRDVRENSTLFALTVDGKKVVPACCFTKGVFLRPVLYIKNNH